MKNIEKVIANGGRMACCALTLTALPSLASAQEAEKPNVLMIMVDDLNDWIGVMNGHCDAITPNLDKLVKRGVFFTNAHCSQPVSTASRNSLMSGKHPANTGWYTDTKSMEKTYEKVMGKNVMLPQYFKEHGYQTYAGGKIFHNGICDYKERKDDMWTGYARSFWSKMEPHIVENAKGYRGFMFYPFPKGGGQLYQAYLEEYGADTMEWFKKNNRFYSLCGGPLDEEDIPKEGMYDEQIASWAIDKLDGFAKAEKGADPFFLAVGFIRPHVPFTAPRRFFDMYDPEKIVMPQIPEDEMSDIPLMGKAIAFSSAPRGDWFDVNRVKGVDRELVHAYLASTTFMDEQLGRLMDAFDASGLAKNTIIVLCSDHGQHLGEKRSYRKQDLWEEATRIPMLICMPEGSQAEKDIYYEHPVTLLDLYPTLVSMCGLPTNNFNDGQDLSPILKDVKSMETKPAVISWKYGNFAVRSTDWRYIQYRDGSEELYDHRVDPGEFKNLASDPSYKKVIAQHKQYIPKNPALPAGKTKFTGDSYEKRLKEWEKNGVPEWLQ